MTAGSTSGEARSRVGARAGGAVRLLASVAALALLAYFVDVRAVADALAESDPALLALALLVALADRALMIGKWIPLLAVQLPSFPLVRAVRVYMASSAASLLLPASVGGDMVRAVALGRDRHAIVEVGASIAAERLLGLLASAVMATAALALALGRGLDVRLLLPWSLGGIALGGIALLLLASERASRWLQRGWRGGRALGLLRRLAVAHDAYRRRGEVVLMAGMLSLAEQLLPVAIYWCAAAAIGVSVDVAMLVVAVPLTLFIGRLPITFAGFGVMEGAFVYLLGLHGVPASSAFAVALAARAIDLAVLLPGALFFGDLAGSGRVSVESSERLPARPRTDLAAAHPSGE